jgi:hypothetical protein
LAKEGIAEPASAKNGIEDATAMETNRSFRRAVLMASTRMGSSGAIA